MTLDNDHFAAYTQAIIEFNGYCCDPNFPTDRPALGMVLGECCFDLLTRWIAATRTDDRYTEVTVHDLGWVIVVDARTESPETCLHVGLNREGFYLQLDYGQESFLSKAWSYETHAITEVAELGAAELQNMLAAISFPSSSGSALAVV